MRIGRAAALLLAGLQAFALAPGQVRAQPEDGARRTVELLSDTLAYDRARDRMTARGHVEIRHAGRLLRADAVIYDRAADRMEARGNVSIREPSGRTVLADEIDISGDLKDGVARRIRILLTEAARISAERAERIGAARTELKDAAYTPCRRCPEEPARAPSWELKADRVIHDSIARDIVYRDAWLEVGGIPILYTPYFIHPDPTVERSSGLLIPTVGSDAMLGLVARAPIFLDLAPDRDATFTPIVTSREGLVGLIEYRHRFPGGLFVGEGSLTRGSTQTERSATRGHFDGRLRYDIDGTWRTGIDVALASDDTYLGRYRLSSDKILTSNLFLEGFGARRHVVANLFRFQGLRPGDRFRATPLIQPEIEASYLGVPDRFGGRTGIEAGLRVLTRRSGEDNLRLSLESLWTRPLYGAGGHLVTLEARLRGDAYLSRAADADRFAEPVGRVFPQVGLDWRYPLIRATRFGEIVFTPITGLIAGPALGRRTAIVNEDARHFELDDTNVFAASRPPGRDLIEDGQRLKYGAELALLDRAGWGATGFLGQSYRISGSRLLSDGGSGPERFSDLVGRAALDLDAFGELSYHFRLDREDLSVERSELAGTFGPETLTLAISYLWLDNRNAARARGERQELRLRLAGRLSENVHASGSLWRDVAASRDIQQMFEIGYADDCLSVTLNLTRSFTWDRDIRPTDSLFLRMRLIALDGD